MFFNEEKYKNMRKAKKGSNQDTHKQLSIFDDLPLFNYSEQPDCKSQLVDKLEKTETHNLATISKLLVSNENQKDNDEKRTLSVPDRFESLEIQAKNKLHSIIKPVNYALEHLDDKYNEMRYAGRGAFLVLRGNSGSGKSTFLHTVKLFKLDVETLSIKETESIPDFLKSLPNINQKNNIKLWIIVIEEREALTDFSVEQLEKDLHSINRFIRSQFGNKTLIVWPCNTDDLEKLLINLAQRIGADSLLGIGQPSYKFNGVPKEQYADIAIQTIALLNEGSTLADLGVSEERAIELVQEVDTIGKYLGLLSKELSKNQKNVDKLLDQEKCKVWIVIIAGNNPEPEVAGLTRGAYSKADIDCLLKATKANIVEELKKYSDKVGILCTVLEAKIIYLPIATARSIIMNYADDKLKQKMKEFGINISKDKVPITVERLMKSQLAKGFQGEAIERSSSHSRPSSDSTKSFEKISQVAKDNDQLLNMAIGKCLQENGIINSFKTEAEFRGKITMRSDLICETNDGKVRLELTWRKWVSSGEISKYVLEKLQKYGQAIGLLE